MIETGRGSAQRGDSPSVTWSRVGEAVRSREARAEYERRFGFAGYAFG